MGSDPTPPHPTPKKQIVPYGRLGCFDKPKRCGNTIGNLLGPGFAESGQGTLPNLELSCFSTFLESHFITKDLEIGPWTSRLVLGVP